MPEPPPDQIRPNASLDLYVEFRENQAENHYTGGTPLPAWVPADK